MKIIDRGEVYSGSGNRQSCAFPSICVMPTGRWMCSFRAAPTKAATAGQQTLVAWSDDHGATWYEPISPFATAPIGKKVGVFRAGYLTALGNETLLAALLWVDNSDPSLPFFNEETEGLLDTRIFFSESNDGGATWSTPTKMDTTPFDMPTPLTGPVLILPDGSWACQFELNKTYYDTTPWHHSSVMMFSKDRGKTWPEHAITSSDPENKIFYWDQRPAVLNNGLLLDLFWTYDNVAGKYLTIHARESLDCGRTWLDMWDTKIPGQPALPVSIGDDLTAMVYVDRTAAPAIKVVTSRNCGRSWDAGTELTLYDSRLTSQTRKKSQMQDAWSEMGKFSVGLPATAPLTDGEFLVVYYAGAETDKTAIEWVRVGKS